jgi:tetratricopeptide (TPR) repeat protein
LSKWQAQKYAYQYCLSERNLQELDSLHSQLYWSKNFLFDYGKILRNNKQYAKSNEILRKGEKISSDPMFLNLIGRNYYDLKDYEQAVHYFERSINRLPGRLYPYYLLAKVYADSCNYNAERFSAAYKTVMRLTPKVQSQAIRQMRAKLHSFNDSINHVTEIQ